MFAKVDCLRTSQKVHLLHSTDKCIIIELQRWRRRRRSLCLPFLSRRSILATFIFSDVFEGIEPNAAAQSFQWWRRLPFAISLFSLRLSLRLAAVIRRCREASRQITKAKDDYLQQLLIKRTSLSNRQQAAIKTNHTNTQVYRIKR